MSKAAWVGCTAMEYLVAQRIETIEHNQQDSEDVSFLHGPVRSAHTIWELHPPIVPSRADPQIAFQKGWNT